MKSFGQLISEQPVHDKLDQLTHNIPLSKKRLKQMAQPSSLSLKFDFDSWQGYHPPSNSSKVVFDEIQYLIGLQEFRDQWEDDIKMHDTKVMETFRKYVAKHDLEIDLDRIKKISDQADSIILSLKRFYNRPRPKVLADKLDIGFSFFPLKTAETPSYPSGHATHGRLVAKLVADEVPFEHRADILSLGDAMGEGRMVAGAHYPSDTEFGHRLGDELYRLTTDLTPTLKLEDLLDNIPEHDIINRKELLLMGSNKKANDMEYVIVSAAGGAPFESDLIPNSKQVGQKIVKNLRLSGKGKMANNVYPTSGKWQSYGKGSNDIAKTDFIVGRDRISLKTGDARLMSGGRDEAKATFYVAAEQSNASLDEMVTKIGEHLENMLPNTDARKLPGDAKGTMAQLKKSGKLADIDVLRKADEAHNAFTKDLRAAFSSNPDFANAFTFEAMTGKVKFNNNEGTADQFLITDYKGNASMHKCTSRNDAYVKKVARLVKPDVGWKSNSSKAAALKSPQNPKGKTGYYNFFSIVGLNIKMKDIVDEEIQVLQNQLDEGLIDEGKFWDKMKDVWQNAMNKARDFLIRMWNKIKAIISQSWEALISFMMLEPVVRYNNNIRWPK